MVNGVNFSCEFARITQVIIEENLKKYHKRRKTKMKIINGIYKIAITIIAVVIATTLLIGFISGVLMYI